MPKALIFSGQGAQKVGMGRSLYESSSKAKALYNKANEVLGYDFSRVCFEGPEEELTKTNVCQAALYVHGIAVLALWKETFPSETVGAALGLSLGELTALALAEVYDFEVGLQIVAERGRLMQIACEESDGGMASVLGGTREQVFDLAAEFDVDVANLNCPGQIVISGPSDRINEAVEVGKGRGFKRVLPLTVGGAYHSRLMEPARAAFEDYLSDISFFSPEIPVFSNVDAQASDDPDTIKGNLVKQVVSSVLWEDCMWAANAVAEIDGFIECGMAGVLKGMAKRIDRDMSVDSFETFEDFQESGDVSS